jgi:hypothetical protein
MLKKTILFISIFIFISTLCYPTVINNISDKSIQIDLINEVISTSSFFQSDISNAGDYNYIDFFDSARTTGNLRYKNSKGKVITSNTLTRNTPLPIFGYKFIDLIIYNPSANAVVTLNGNIRLFQSK